MGKRGQLVYKYIIVLIASAIVLFAFISAGKSYGSQEAFYKLAVAKDIALTIDLMYSLPGDIVYTYPNDVSNYDIEIKGNTVKVYNHNSGKPDPTTASYNYAGTDADSLDFSIQGQKFIKLEKADDKIKIMGVNDLEQAYEWGKTGGGGAGGSFIK